MSHEYAIPMYLDTTALLDILASIEDGFSMSNNVTTISSNSKNTELSGKAGLDIPSLSIHFGGMGKKESESGSSVERIAEKNNVWVTSIQVKKKPQRKKFANTHQRGR